MCRTEELSHWLRLTLVQGVGVSTALQLLKSFGLPEQIFSANYAQLIKVVSEKIARSLLEEPNDYMKQTIEQTLEWLDLPNHGILTLVDAPYPKQLLEMPDPPILLYYDGLLEALETPMLAVVGARNATVAGEQNAFAFSRYLADQGWCIVSGLASGIDSQAHKGALASQGLQAKTIAVMGTGINRIYPASNRDLAVQIKENGLLLSEFALNTRAESFQFPKRNRIIAGLSKGVLVVEASKQSGAVLTAKMATELGREVFAIPGSIHSTLSKGCHQLIKDGAKLVDDAQDIMEEIREEDKPVKPLSSKGLRKVPSAKELPPEGNDQDKLPISEAQQQLLNKMGFEPWGLDALSQLTHKAPEMLSILLLDLELKDWLNRLPDGRYQRQ